MSCAGFCYRAAPPWSSARFALHPVRSAKRPDGFLLSTGNALLTIPHPHSPAPRRSAGGRPPRPSSPAVQYGPSPTTQTRTVMRPPAQSPRREAACHHATPGHVQTDATGLMHPAPVPATPHGRSATIILPDQSTKGAALQEAMRPFYGRKKSRPKCIERDQCYLSVLSGTAQTEAVP